MLNLIILIICAALSITLFLAGFVYYDIWSIKRKLPLADGVENIEVINKNILVYKSLIFIGGIGLLLSSLYIIFLEVI